MNFRFLPVCKCLDALGGIDCRAGLKRWLRVVQINLNSSCAAPH
jgi:hypothetical protein